MDWRQMPAHVTGTVDQGLLLRNEYLLAENRILRSQIQGKPKLNDAQRKSLAEIGKRLGRKALAADGSPLVVTAWIPLSEATERNGCIRVVPARLDPAYGTAAEDDLSATARARALAASPGDWICWNDALLHWGGACLPGEPPRVSLSMQFQRGDAAPFNRPLLWPLADLEFGRRVQLVAMQLLQYEHFCPLAPVWREFSEGQVSG